MKNLKYIKLFEAFKSDKLTKTLGYVKFGKKDFLRNVKKLLKSLDFPESKISDDYFEYLPFNKALKKADIITDEPCGATSAEEFPQFAVEGAKCEDGKMKRKWGKGIRKVECPVCGGTGIKPKRPGDIRLVKFWFSKGGDFVSTSVVDGIIRKLRQKKRQLSNNLSDYRVGRRVSKENVLKLKTGSFLLLNIKGKEVICYILKTPWNTYALQYSFDGENPGYGYEWRDIATYSWLLGGSDHSGGKLLYPIDDEDKEPDPYTWNIALNFTWSGMSIDTRSNLEEIIKEAHFALVLDLAKLKKSEFKTKTDIKKEREETKKGAFLTDTEVKNKNIQRYVDEISKSVDIVSDVSNVSKLLKRLLGYKSTLFNIVGNSDSINRIKNLIRLYYQLLEETDEEGKKYLIEAIESNVKNSVDKIKYNKIPENVEIVKNKLIESGEETHLELLNELVKLSSEVYDKIKSYDVETIEDLEVINQKILSIRNIFNSTRYEIYELSTFFNYLNTNADRAHQFFASSYYGLSESKAEKIIKEIDRIKKIISKI